MTLDPRITPANPRVAAQEWRDRVPGRTYVAGEMQRVIRPVADLRCAPDGVRLDRQLIHGDEFRVLETSTRLCFGQATRGGYVGYLDRDALGDPVTPTHRVTQPQTLAFRQDDIKAPDPQHLPHGATVAVAEAQGRLWRTADGLHIPSTHLSPLSEAVPDPVAVAEIYLGTPYLWGGNSIWGIDCSGLVQAAFAGCGINVPGDSDLQMAGIGNLLPDGVDLARGDLLFWRGHVALAVSSTQILHANAYHMRVAYEPLADALARIEAQGDGPLLARKRPGPTGA